MYGCVLLVWWKVVIWYLNINFEAREIGQVFGETPNPILGSEVLRGSEGSPLGLEFLRAGDVSRESLCHL